MIDKNTIITNSILGTPKLSSIENLSIQKFKKHDLLDFPILENLKKLTIFWGSLRSLSGIEALPNLEFLGLVLLRNLESLKGLENLSNLNRLQIENCPKIPDLLPIKNSHKLELLGIHDGKVLESLKPIQNLNKLQIIHITGNTKFLDGDVKYLIGRKDSFARPWKHYSHSPEEIDKLNGTKRLKQTWDY
jgi:hypothetical protein